MSKPQTTLSPTDLIVWCDKRIKEIEDHPRTKWDTQYAESIKYVKAIRQFIVGEYPYDR